MVGLGTVSLDAATVASTCSQLTLPARTDLSATVPAADCSSQWRLINRSRTAKAVPMRDQALFMDFDIGIR